MTHKVVLRRPAESDLADIYKYIRDTTKDPRLAFGFIERIRQQCLELAQFPNRGRSRDDIRPGLRIIGFERRVVIAYAVEGTTVRIGRIFYGGQDYEALLGEET